jgi:hypothetical protein
MPAVRGPRLPSRGHSSVRAPVGVRRGAPITVVVLALLLAVPLAMTNPGHAAAVGPAGAAARLQTFLRSNGVSPPPTVFGSMAYDAVDGYALMFGGQDVFQDSVGTTWSFRSGNWTNLTPTLSVAPPPRWDAAMTYDSADRELVLFGGCANAQCVPALGDTWTFASGRWADLTPKLNLSPPARGGAAISYDPTGSGAAVLFGGFGGGNGALGMNDTWSFSGGRWTAIVPAGGAPIPAARNSAAFEYDPSLKESILFGGGSAQGVRGDTWAHSNRTWTDLAPAQTSAPSPRRNANSVYDAADGYLLLVGGYDNGAYYGDVWTFGASGWRPLATSNPPTAIYGAEVTYEAHDSVVLFFSGVSADGDSPSTWVYSGSTWQLLLNPAPTFSLGLAVAAGVGVLLFLVLVIVGSAYLSQRWRIRRAAPGFPLGPTEPIRWVERRSGWGARQGPQIAIVLVAAFAVFVPILLVTSAGSTGAGSVVTVVGGIFLAVLLGFALLINRQVVITRVGLTRLGVVFARRVGDTRVAWSNLSPASFQPQRGSYVFQYSTVGARPRTLFAAVSIDQAKAIVASESAPVWPLSVAQAQPLGLEMRSSPMASRPSAPRPARPSRPPVATTAPTGSGRSGAPSVPLPSARLPSEGPEMYAAPPPPPPAPPRWVGPPTDHLVRCGHCGQSFAPAGYAFCPACGARLM